MSRHSPSSIPRRLVLDLSQQRELHPVPQRVFLPLRLLLRVIAYGDVGSWRHGHRGRRRFADQQPPLRVLVLQLEPRLAGRDQPIRLKPVRARLVPSGEHAVLDVQRRVHVLAGRAGARFQETFFKIVAEERVEDRVHRAVAVTEETGQQEAGYGDLALALFRRGVDQRHLHEPVGKPAENVDRDHGQHELRHFTMRSFLLLRLVLRAHRLQLPDHEEVEDQYEDERDGEAQDERVQGEGGVASAIVGPVDVAVDPLLGFHRVRVQKYGYHEEGAGCPGGQRDQLRDERRPNFRRGDRMAHGYVTIRAHDEEEDAAGELVDAGRRHVSLAHHLPEYPTA